jgi:hypothetical protein
MPSTCRVERVDEHIAQLFVFLKPRDELFVVP